MVNADQLRRRWAGIACVLIISVCVAGILAALALHMKRQEGVLDSRGRRTVAAVVATHDRYRWLPDTATVRYEHDGQPFEARVTVGTTDDFPVGSRQEIVYDPENPGHAKPVDGWSSTYSTVTLAALMVLAFGAVPSARRALYTGLARGVAGAGAVMRVETFGVERWWQRWARSWAGVWPLDADPTAVDAALYVPIESLAASESIGFEQPSTVLGVPEPGRLLVIVHGDQVVWPRGRARRGPPRLSTVAGRVRLSNPW